MVYIYPVPIRLSFILIAVMVLFSCSIEKLEEDEYFVERGLPTGLYFYPQEISIGVNDDPVQLELRFYPDGVKTDSVVWSISDLSIATVSDKGVLTPLSMGEATISVRCDSALNEYEEASCTLQVVPDIATFYKASVIAGFNEPRGIVMDNTGYLYVADCRNHTIRKIAPDGTVSTFAGSAGNNGSTDGTGSSARFEFPCGITMDSSGYFYVADSGNHRIRRITPSGEVTTLAGSTQGHTDGIGSLAEFDYPTEIAVDGSGNVFVTDDSNAIRKIALGGTVTTLAGDPMESGSTDGVGSEALFDDPGGIAVDDSGNLYVADYGNHTIRKITPAGVVSTLAGVAGYDGSADGSGTSAHFTNPHCIVLGNSGNLYVNDGDYVNYRIRMITPEGTVSTYLTDIQPYIVSLTINDSGTIYCTGTHSVYSINPDGQCVEITGSSYQGSSDGKPEQYGLASIGGCTMDSAGNLLVVNSGYLMKITPEGTMASLGQIGTGSDQNTFVAADKDDNVYVVDGDETVVKKVSPGGTVTVFAGEAGMSGTSDGTGTSARFTNPGGVAVDGVGNVYVSDYAAHTIRKITPDGTVSTLAGRPGYPGDNDGAGTAAMFNSPHGLAVDGNGNVYVMDYGNDTIRKISPDGVVSTILDPSNQYYSSWGPCRISVDGSGKIFFTYNYAINTLDADGKIIPLSKSSVYMIRDICATSSGRVYYLDEKGHVIVTIDTRRQQ